MTHQSKTLVKVTRNWCYIKHLQNVGWRIITMQPLPYKGSVLINAERDYGPQLHRTR
jgi:hypothetical protein